MRRFSVGRPGRFRPRFPALPCCASRPIHAAPCGPSLPRLQRFPALRLGVVARGGGGVEVFWGVRGVAGARAWERRRRSRGVGGAHGRGAGAGPRYGGFDIFWRIPPNCGLGRFPAGPCGRPRRLICSLHPGSGIALHAAPSGAPMLCPPAHPCQAVGASLLCLSAHSCRALSALPCPSAQSGGAAALASGYSGDSGLVGSSSRNLRRQPRAAQRGIPMSSMGTARGIPFHWVW